MDHVMSVSKRARPCDYLQPIKGPTPMGHEYSGFVEEVGSAVTSVRPGQFVVGSFATSDNTWCWRRFAPYGRHAHLQ